MSDSIDEAEDTAAAPALVDRCFNVQGMTDMSVISDRHIYVRTRGANHYLVTTAECPNLRRSYRRGTARFVPYGSAVCPSDGSYVLHNGTGRVEICPILGVQRVFDRSAARSLADGVRPADDFEEIPAEEESAGKAP